MRIYLTIDDTDNHDSPGSGQLAEVLAGKIQELGLASQCSNITRHQLYFNDAIPYTSHNSSMCFSAVIADTGLDDVIQFSRQFLVDYSAPGSDPGLCIAPDTPSLNREALINFGLMAKESVLTKIQAYDLARQTGIHLSENGGTGDGIIGALAGIGLRLNGNDGRFRGWLKFGEAGHIVAADSLMSHPDVERVVDNSGCLLPGDTSVVLAENSLKTILYDHRQVIPVTQLGNTSDLYWSTLTKSEIKTF